MRPFEMLLQHPTFFAVNRRSISGAIWLGVFLALLPIPGQTALALLGAVLFRINIPVTIVAVWLTNPLTMVPIFYFEYRFGLFLLDMPLQPFAIDLSWQWLVEEFQSYSRPLLLGSLVMATLLASTAYVLVSVSWRMVVAARYRRRKERRPLGKRAAGN